MIPLAKPGEAQVWRKSCKKPSGQKDTQGPFHIQLSRKWVPTNQLVTRIRICVMEMLWKYLNTFAADFCCYHSLHCHFVQNLNGRISTELHSYSEFTLAELSHNVWTEPQRLIQIKRNCSKGLGTTSSTGALGALSLVGLLGLTTSIGLPLINCGKMKGIFLTLLIIIVAEDWCE